MSTFTERLEALTITTHDDGCAYVCAFGATWFVETNIGTETVDADVCDPQTVKDRFSELLPYVEGTRIAWADRRDTWSAYWTMPGYLDRGEDHTAETEAAALVSLLELDSMVDACPLEDMDNGIPAWELEALERLATLADAGDPAAAEYLDRFLA